LMNSKHTQVGGPLIRALSIISICRAVLVV